MKRTKRIAAGAASLAMVASMALSMPLGAGAAGTKYDVPSGSNNALITGTVSTSNAFSDTNGTAISADITTDNTTMLKKVLEIEDGTNIPACSFTFTATAGSAVNATNSTLAVLAGVDPDKITYKTVADNSSAHLAFATAGSAAITASTVTTAGSESSAIPIAYAANGVTLGSNNAASGSTITVTNDNVVLSDGNATTYYAEKEVELDFSGCGFTEPGVYRYIITETATSGSANTGINNDTNATRTLDVYVEDASYYTRTGDSSNYTYTYNKKLKIAGYVMYVGTQTAGPSNSTTTTSGTATTMEDNTTKTPNGIEVASATKSVGFKNSYETEDLTFSKTVTGNQGSKDKYFAFTVKIENAVAGTVYDVSYADDSNANTTDGDADANISANPNNATTCINTAVTQPDKLTVGNDGTVTQTFYLQHGQKIAIRGLAKGTKYTITEAPEDYTPSAVATAGDDKNTGDASGTGTAITLSNNAMSDDYIQDDAVIDFTNTRKGTIPTGILLSVAAPAGVGIVVIGGIAYLLIKNKRRKAEEE